MMNTQRRRKPGGRRFFPRRKVCQFCVDKDTITYKNVQRNKRFISDWGKIDSRRKTGTCSPHQRQLALAIKRARFLALLPYSGSHSLMELARPFDRDRGRRPFRGDGPPPRYDGPPAGAPPAGAPPAGAPPAGAPPAGAPPAGAPPADAPVAEASAAEAPAAEAAVEAPAAEASATEAPAAEASAAEAPAAEAPAGEAPAAEAPAGEEPSGEQTNA